MEMLRKLRFLICCEENPERNLEKDLWHDWNNEYNSRVKT